MVKQVANDARTSALVLEEELLGADFVQSGEIWVPGSYLDVSDEVESSERKVMMVDLTCAGVLSVSGAGALLFLNTMTTADVSPLQVGRGTAGLALTAQGEVIDAFFVLKTGDESYTVIGSGANAAELREWLCAHAKLERKGVRAFEDVTVEDETGKLTLLSLVGKGARDVLADYVSSKEDLPQDGQVASVTLDSIEALVFRIDGDDAKSFYLLFLPPHQAVALFRSLMSFDQIMPAGLECFKVLLQREEPGLGLVWQDQYATPQQAHLMRLIRNDRDFVGSGNVGEESR